MWKVGTVIAVWGCLQQFKKQMMMSKMRQGHWKEKGVILDTEDLQKETCGGYLNRANEEEEWVNIVAGVWELKYRKESQFFKKIFWALFCPYWF